MKRHFLKGVLLCLCIGMASPTWADKEDKQDEIKALVKYRTKFMKLKNDHNVAIRMLTRKMPMSGSERAAQVITHAEALNKMASDMLRLFSVPSHTEESRATEGIWNKNGDLTDEFVGMTRVMQSEANHLAILAREGNMQLVKKQVRRLARSCRGCHTEYREE